MTTPWNDTYKRNYRTGETAAILPSETKAARTEPMTEAEWYNYGNEIESGSGALTPSRVVTRHRRSRDVASISPKDSTENKPVAYRALRTCRGCRLRMPVEAFGPTRRAKWGMERDDQCIQCRAAIDERCAARQPRMREDGVWEVPLTRGFVAIVDGEDFPIVAGHSWCYIKAKKARTGYACGSAGLMHRLILGAPAHLECDHIDGDGLNNRRSNLRLATKAENGRNRKVLCIPKASRFKGVWWEKRRNRWKARITVDSKSIDLGSFRVEEDAAIAYDRAAVRYFGEFARLNFAEDSEG